jgi:hypothetical protein
MEPPLVMSKRPPRDVGTKQLELDVQDSASGTNGIFGWKTVPATTGSVVHVCPPSVLK